MAIFLRERERGREQEREGERGILIHSSAGSKNSPRTEGAVCLGRRAHAHPPTSVSYWPTSCNQREGGQLCMDGRREDSESQSRSTLLSLHPVAHRHTERLKTPSLTLIPSHKQTHALEEPPPPLQKRRKSVHPSWPARCLCLRYTIRNVWWYGCG